LLATVVPIEPRIRPEARELAEEDASGDRAMLLCYDPEPASAVSCHPVRSLPMIASPTAPAPLPTPGRLFQRWRRWLKRIEGEFIELLVQQQHLHALQEIWNLNVGKLQRPEIGRWMAQSYVAYACTTIRRLVEPPKKSPPKSPKKDPKLCISLVILLREVQDNAALFTRDRLRRVYTRGNRSRTEVFECVADQVFDDVVQNSRAQSLPPARIDRDVRAISRATRSIERFVNKKIAHHERHSGRVGRPIRFDEIDGAIRVLVDYFKRYSLFVAGRWCDPRLEGDDWDIRPDLKRLWPDAECPAGW
jgi:hypothetical protein